MKIISLRTQPEYTEQAIQYFQNNWPEVNPIIYENCIRHSIDAKQPLPQWYLLEQDHSIIGCADLITNDFIGRMDLYIPDSASCLLTSSTAETVMLHC